VRAVQQKSIDKSYAAKPKFDKKGKILPHERVRLLLMLIHLLSSYVV
jgi:geranyl-CoA carboxylase beta subunit